MLFWAHLYRGLVYESIDDFEAARLELVKAHDYALKTESLYLRAATAILAHSEIRLNRIREAEKLIRDALETVEKVPMDVRSPMRPMVILGLAELLAAKKDWTASNEKFRKSLELIHGAIYGVLYEAIIRTRFGEALLKQGLNSEAREQFSQAARLYEKLGNVTQAQRVMKLLTSL